MGRHRTPLARLAISATALLAYLCAIDPGGAFELNTHERISEAAFSKSVLGGGDYLERELALSPGRLLRGIFRETGKPEDWIRRGSRREDDLNLISRQPVRVRHHFYDPVHDRPLSAPPVGAFGYRAPDWALEIPEVIPGQDFSWRDARRSFHNALTAELPTVREVELARTFLMLGHVIHLIQDMGVPEHTRNDWHVGLPLIPAGTPSIFESHISGREPKFVIDTYPPPRFDQLRHFWSTGDGRGLAEFTNRNFVSKDTVFEALEEGAVGRDPRTGHVYPSPQLRLALREDVDIATLPDPPRGLSGRVTFFLRHVDDRVTGEVLEDRRMVSFSLFDAALERRGAKPIFTVNRYVVDDAASLLLPRAVGYSAALLDYFFRGRLDGDVVAADPLNPDHVRFDGRNASSEALAGGTLTLYGEDAAGVRTRLSPVTPGADLTVQAEPGAPVRSVVFQASRDAERFVAVYQGTLGHEAPGADPSRDPGAVIGKVLGGVRVEQLFSDGTEWKLRTPKGIFGFEPPLPASAYEVVKWGDARDLFVARTRFEPGAPNRIDVYAIRRQGNSTDVDTVGTGPQRRVPTTLVRSLPWPTGGIATGTTVRLSHRAIEQQAIIVNTSSTTFGCEVDPRTGEEATVHIATETAPGDLQILPAMPVHFTRSVPLVLDVAHLAGQAARDYDWWPADITLDPDGRVLAVVWVQAREPDIAPAPVPLYGVDKDSGGVIVIGQNSILPRYPQGGETLLWALVDVEAARVLIKTAEPEIVQSHTTYHIGAPEVWLWSKVVGGCGSPPPRTSASRDHPGRLDDDVITVTGRVDERLGDEDISLAGLLRTDLRAALATAGFVDSQVSVIARTDLSVYYCEGRGPRRCLALEVSSRQSGAARNPAYLEDVRRPPRAGSGERLVLLARDYTTGGQPLGALAVLSGDSTRLLDRPQADLVRFRDVTSAAALVTEERFADPLSGPRVAMSRLLDLGGSRPPIEFPGERLSDFVLLEPLYLYRTTDLKFYRLASPLQRTVLPAPLAQPGPPAGSYHTVPLR
jgi:hypothetical protein